MTQAGFLIRLALMRKPDCSSISVRALPAVTEAWRRHGRRASETGDSARALAMLLLSVLLAATSGCSVLNAPQRVVTAVVPGKNSPPADPLGLQVEIERYADNFTLLTVSALDDYARLEGTES